MLKFCHFKDTGTLKKKLKLRKMSLKIVTVNYVKQNGCRKSLFTYLYLFYFYITWREGTLLVVLNSKAPQVGVFLLKAPQEVRHCRVPDPAT